MRVGIAAICIGAASQASCQGRARQRGAQGAPGDGRAGDAQGRGEIPQMTIFAAMLISQKSICNQWGPVGSRFSRHRTWCIGDWSVFPRILATKTLLYGADSSMSRARPRTCSTTSLSTTQSKRPTLHSEAYFFSTPRSLPKCANGKIKVWMCFPSAV